MTDNWTGQRHGGRRIEPCRSFNSNDFLPVEIRSVLRLRPLNKKERDDHVLLEAPRATSTNNSATVVMKALPRSEHVAAASASTRESYSPFASPEMQDTNSKSSSTTETDFFFNHAFGESATQDLHVFADIGRPMTLAAMEPLFSNNATCKTHVNIAVGTTGSGKSFTCWGHNSSGGMNLKRKVPGDGMIPRTADSLFGQYHRLSGIKKHAPKLKGKTFAVKIWAYQVNQPKHTNTPSRDAGRIYDLLSYSSNKTTTSRRLSMERNRTSNAASLPSTTSDRSGSSSSVDGEAIYIDQNPLTHDFRVMNAKFRNCRSGDEARDALQDILVAIRRVSNRRQQCHVLVQMQPVLLDQTKGKVVREGGRIVFLDMAGSEDFSGASKAARNRLLSKRLKDSFPSRCDGHAALIHCMRSILYNEVLRQGKNPPSKHGRQATPKQVPYLQHKITMLLQPYFSTNHSDKAIVTMLVTASPGHRDYMEKRELMTEVESLWKPFHRICAQAHTGLNSDENLGSSSKAMEKNRSSEQKKHVSGYQRDDDESGRDQKENSIGHHHRKPRASTRVVAEVVELSRSDSTEDFSLPPPIAPQDFAKSASAPMEDLDNSKVILPMDRTPLSDFPGVFIAQAAASPAYYQSSSFEHPTPNFHQADHDYRQRHQSPSFSLSPSSQGSESLAFPPSPPTQHRPAISRIERNRTYGESSGTRKRMSSRSPAKPVTKHTDSKTTARSKRSKQDCVDRELEKTSSTEQIAKKKWSKTVEVTTRTVETSNDPALLEPSESVSSVSEVETMDSALSELKEENLDLKEGMSDLQHQNEILQRELRKMKMQKPRKSVSFRVNSKKASSSSSHHCRHNHERCAESDDSSVEDVTPAQTQHANRPAKIRSAPKHSHQTEQGDEGHFDSYYKECEHFQHEPKEPEYDHRRGESGPSLREQAARLRSCLNPHPARDPHSEKRHTSRQAPSSGAYTYQQKRRYYD